MSFACPKRIIEEGDTVVLYLSVFSMHVLDIKRQITTNKGLKVILDKILLYQ